MTVLTRHTFARRAASAVSLMSALMGSCAAASAADRNDPYIASAVDAPEPDPGRLGPIRQKLGDWNVIVGGGGLIGPEYEGSDEFDIIALPFISATYDDWLAIDPMGLSVKLLDRELFEMDAKVGYESGRAEDDSDDLRGLGDVDFGVTLGGKAALNVGPAQFYVEVDKTIEGSDGLLGTAGVELSYAISSSLLLTVGASATVADENHMDAYFSIDKLQSARSGYRDFEADAGLKRADFSASVTYGVTENWFVRGDAGVGLLLGDAADSPIVRDEIQPSGILLVGYRF